MKKNAAIFALIFAASLSWANGYNIEVGTNSTVVVPQQYGKGNTWSNGTVFAAGDYTKSSDGYTYWTPTGGTSTNEPVSTPWITTLDDGVTWVDIRRGRTFCTVQIASDTDEVFTNINSPAEVDKGFELRSTSTVLPLYNFAGEVRAITETGTATLQVVFY